MILIDAHAHIYGLFDLDRFFDETYRNFRHHASSNPVEEPFQAMIIIADWPRQKWFEKLAALADGRSLNNPKLPKRWKFTRTEDPEGLIARNQRDETLLVVAGCKIVTRENLEVIAPFTQQPPEDRQRLGDTIDAIVGTGNPAFIPWAMGKWLGSRGGILAAYLAKALTDHVFLCDSSTRPVFWPTPNHFKLARRYGIRILAGSDPLHFPSEVNRAGSFGFSLPEMVSDQNPVQDLKRYLRDRNLPIKHFGALETPWRFLRNQFAMQALKKKHQRHLQSI